MRDLLRRAARWFLVPIVRRERMTVCVVHQDHEADEGWLCCRRAWGRLAGSLRQIPGLVAELHGLGYVQRDHRERPDDLNGRWADPIAHALPAGPLNGSRNGAKVSGSPGRSAPIRIDPTDLLGPARVFRLAGPPGAVEPREPCRFCRERHVTDLHPPTAPVEPPDRYRDQVGYTSVASTLDFWATDWANLRNEGRPFPSVPVLCSWLLDRLDWACQHHFALDEFAGHIQTLSSRLYGLAGYGASRPKVMEAVCPGCGFANLAQPYPDAYIECAMPDCGRVLTPVEYEEMVREMRHEIRAQDVLTVLNGGAPCDIEKIRFAVIVDDDEDMRGEVLVLLGGRRFPGLHRLHHSVVVEEFKTLDEALARRSEVLKTDSDAP